MLLLKGISLFLLSLIFLLACRRILFSWAAVALYKFPPKGNYGKVPFTIVCPCKNEITNLPRLVKSLSKINYPEALLRIILIDDSSTDGSDVYMEEAAKKYSNWKAVLYKDSKQRGKATAIREFLDQDEESKFSSGWVMIVDADHALMPDGLSRLIDYIHSKKAGAITILHQPINAFESIPATYCFLEGAVNEWITSRAQDALSLVPTLSGVYGVSYNLMKKYYPGGWYLLDDMEFTSRLTAAGYRIAYASDVYSEHVLPNTLKGYHKQHLRWNGGFLEGFKSSFRLLMENRKALDFFKLMDSLINSSGYFERYLFLLAIALGMLFIEIDIRYTIGILLAILFWSFSVLIQLFTALSLSGIRMAQWGKMIFTVIVMFTMDLATSIQGIIFKVFNKEFKWKANK